MVNRTSWPTTYRWRRGEGQALVEFALSLPVILAVLAGFLGMAYLFYSWITLYHAANEGVSYAVRNPQATEVEIVNNGVKPNMFALYDASSVVVRKYPDRVTVAIEYEVPLPTVRIPLIFTDGELVILQPLSVRVRSIAFYD